MTNKNTELTATFKDDGQKKQFEDAARASGLCDVVCARCTRPFLTRADSDLCPPCRGDSKPDGWTPAHTYRKLDLGSPVVVPTMIECHACLGLGSPGWEPYAPFPRCEHCNGHGQVLP